jgi:hypothetical protein
MAKLPSKPFLTKSLKKWERALKDRRKKHNFYHNESQRPDAERTRLAAKWHKKVEQAEYWVSRRRGELARYGPAKPRIITAKQAGIWQSNVFGSLGDETKVTTHYAASPRARNLKEGIRLALQFAGFHRSKGWGTISYAYLIPDTGEIICGRSTAHKAAHVANMNAGNIGINFFCTTGDAPTDAQTKSAQWLVANAHTKAMPKLHRTDRDLRKADIRGHNAWPGQSTGCPGHFTPRNLGV